MGRDVDGKTRVDVCIMQPVPRRGGSDGSFVCTFPVGVGRRGEAEARIRMGAGGQWGQSKVVPQGHLGNEPGLCNWMHWRGRSRSMLGCMWGFLPWLSWVMQTRLLKALSISYIHAPLHLWDHSGTSGTGVTISVTTGRVLHLSSFVRVSQKYQSGRPGT